MIKLKELLMEMDANMDISDVMDKVANIDREISTLEKEWDRLDSMGGKEHEQRMISSQLQTLRYQRQKIAGVTIGRNRWDALRKKIVDTPEWSPIKETSNQRFPAVKTKDGRVFIGRIHADAVAKTGDSDLESVGWWDGSQYYTEEESRKQWGAVSTDTLEPELHRAWRLNKSVSGMTDQPVNEISTLLKVFVGDCRTILDTSDIFSDATQMAQAVENSNSLTYEQFTSNVSLKDSPRMLVMLLRKSPHDFSFGQHNNLIWAYNQSNDIHYFFL